nr:hypothetical protein [uncultured Sphaerochaeta sp.]
MKLVIFGGSGIGMIAASIAMDLENIEIVGFLNDEVPVGSKIGKFRQIPVIGKSEDYKKFLDDKDVSFFISYVGMQKEEKVYQKIKEFEICEDRYASLIHPTAYIPSTFSEIGKGVLFAPYSQLSPDTKISNHCMLLGNSFIGHDSFMDEFAHLATNSVVGANVHIGKACHIGSNCTIREKLTIGDFSLVGAGAVVLNDFDSHSIIVGNPARLLRKTS